LNEAELAEALATDWRSADLTESFRALLDYADRLTRNPSSIRETDLESLRNLGYTDDAILRVCEVVSYYNFVNRMAEDGLGVALEPAWPHPLIGPWKRPDSESGTGEGG
jgi:uncharacterized peroxidase-related enzyme